MADRNRPDTPMGRALARRAPVVEAPPGDLPEVAGLLDLTAAEPQETAEPIRAAARVALERGETHYTARTGILPLREAIAAASTADGFPASADEAAVTNGGFEALYIALQASLQPGERACLCAPVAPRVLNVVRFIGAEPVILAEAGEARLEGCTVVVLSAPSALSSLAVPADRLVALLEAAGRQNVTAIIDRSAAPDYYQPAPPFARPDLAAGAITIGSFSGGYGLAGWQVGYFTSPPAGMGRLAGLKESMSISTTTLSQFAALAALEHADEVLATRRAHFAGRRALVSEILEMNDVPFIQPAVYPWLLIDVRQAGIDDTDVAARLSAEAGVVVEPASMYGESLSGYVRVNLAAPETTLLDGVTILAMEVGPG